MSFSEPRRAEKEEISARKTAVKKMRLVRISPEFDGDVTDCTEKPQRLILALRQFGEAQPNDLCRHCGVGIGMVFASGTSTGGSDIVVRLLKLRFRNVPVGQISMMIDLTVAVLTGIVFNNIVNTLYIGVAVFLTTKIMDMVIYRFDYSKVALIITKEHEKVAQVISDNLGRGATYLHGQGTYTGADTKVVLTAIKRQQLAELKDIVIQIDPNAFIIVQEAHQVLGDGFARHSKDSL